MIEECKEAILKIWEMHQHIKPEFSCTLCKAKVNPPTCEGCPVYVTIFNPRLIMSRRNAKFATIHDLQGHISDCTLTKRDLEFIVRGLREMDKYNFTNRDVSDHDKLVKYLSRLTHSKR